MSDVLFFDSSVSRLQSWLIVMNHDIDIGFIVLKIYNFNNLLFKINWTDKEYWILILFRKSSNAVEQLRLAIGNEHFDAVVDFSAYDSDVVKDALKVLDDHIKLYIYISTDSVYEVRYIIHIYIYIE